MTALLVVNAVLGLVATGFAVAALVRPAAMAGTTTGGPGTTLYARMYAARGIPLGIALAWICLANLHAPHVAVPWLLVGGVVQAADAVILAPRRNPGMLIGPIAAAVVHLGTALLVVL